MAGYDFAPALKRHASSDPRPLTMEIGGRVVLIPTVRPDGSVMSDAEAVQMFFASGSGLGQYATRAQAEEAAGLLSGLLAQG